MEKRSSTLNATKRAYQSAKKDFEPMEVGMNSEVVKAGQEDGVDDSMGSAWAALRSKGIDRPEQLVGALFGCA